jgi:transcriptional regulator with XRE-family HTH domain
MGAIDGPKLKALRLQKGVTSEELAEKSGVARQTIVEIENGHRQAREKTLLALCKALGIEDPAVLLPAAPAGSAPAGGGDADKKTA